MDGELLQVDCLLCLIHYNTLKSNAILLSNWFSLVPATAHSHNINSVAPYSKSSRRNGSVANVASPLHDLPVICIELACAVHLHGNM